MNRTVVVSGILLIFLVTLLFATCKKAHANPLLLLVAGGLLAGSGNGEEELGGGASVIYTMPNVSKRVKDPFAVRTICTKKLWMSRTSRNDRPYHDVAGSSLWDIFKLATNCEQKDGTGCGWVILQIVRVFDAHPVGVSFWFMFTERSNIQELSPAAAGLPRVVDSLDVTHRSTPSAGLDLEVNLDH
jgi:hypothetical protein